MTLIPTNPANMAVGRQGKSPIIGVFHRTGNAGNDTALGEANYSHGHILKASFYKVVDANGRIVQVTLPKDTEFATDDWVLNTESLNYELTGTNGSVLTPAQLQALIADIKADPATKQIANHRLSLADIASRRVSGWCTHRDITIALKIAGGHTDFIGEGVINRVLKAVYS